MKLTSKIASFTVAIIATGSVVAETRMSDGVDRSFRITETAQVVTGTLDVSESGEFLGRAQHATILFTVDTAARVNYTDAWQQQVELVASAPVTIETIVEPARLASR